MRRAPVILMLVLLVGCLLVGCNFWRLHGDTVREIPTERLSAGGVRVELPVDVPTAAAAFAEALSASGYPIAYREVSGGRATLVGKAAGQRAKINLHARASGALAVVSIGPMSDSDTSQRLIDAAKSRLGLR